MKVQLVTQFHSGLLSQASPLAHLCKLLAGNSCAILGINDVKALGLHTGYSPIATKEQA